MSNWLRWILVLPTAVLAFVAIQVGVGLGSETLPYGDAIQDWLSQLINSIVGPWAFPLLLEAPATSERVVRGPAPLTAL